MLRRDPSVVVAQAQAVVAPYYCCAPSGTTGGDTAAAFAIFLGVAAFWGKPVARLRTTCEGAEGGCREAVRGGPDLRCYN